MVFVWGLTRPGDAHHSWVGPPRRDRRLGGTWGLIRDQQMANLTERGGAACREEDIRAILAKPYWTYEESALVLGVTTKTLRNMKWKRELSFSKFGRRIYISRDLVMKELRQNMVLCPATALGERHRKAEGDGTGRP